MPSETAPRLEAGRQQLTGTVVSRFDDATSEAFQAGRIRVADRDIPFVAEYLPHLRPGILASLSGFWEHHPEHGRQLRVVQLHSARLPNTADAVERLLLDVPGFGRSYAKKVVAVCGPNVLETLVRDSAFLTRMIPGKRGRTLRLGWDRWLREWQERQDGLGFAADLVGLGCTLLEARRVLEFFRSPVTARVVLLRHPYRLLEVPGLSWGKVERIAERLGVMPTDPERLIAAAVTAANDLLNRGHSAVRCDDLGRAVTRLVGQPGMERRATELAVDAGELVENDLIYLPQALQAEWAVASQLRRLAKRNKTLEQEQEVALHGHLEVTPLNAEQRNAVENACRCGVTILTGGPGTGKTTATKQIVIAAQMLGEAVSIIAPTGRAAMRSSEVTGVPASTIHKAIGGPPGSTRDKPIRDDLVVLEECSMVAIETMAWLLQNLSPRTRLVLVGDADQLPSVEHGALLRDLLDSGQIPTVRLNSVYRQGEESGIIVAARKVLAGQELDGHEGRGFYWADTADHNEAFVAKRIRDAVTWLSSQWPATDIQVLSPTKLGILGTKKLNVELQVLLNPDGAPGPAIGDDATVRVGDRVIQVRNDYSLGKAGIMNGQQGMVVDVDRRKILVTIDDETLWIEDHRLYNLRLAWAVTIHKSQGSEWPHVVVVAHPSHGVLLGRQILYTALTRAQQNAVLVSNHQALTSCSRHDTRASRSTGLNRHLGLHYV